MHREPTVHCTAVYMTMLSIRIWHCILYWEYFEVTPPICESEIPGNLMSKPFMHINAPSSVNASAHSLMHTVPVYGCQAGRLYGTYFEVTPPICEAEITSA